MDAAQLPDYDIVVFGATAYTGQYIVEETAKLCQDKPITWAVAGRNRTKIEAVLTSVGEVLGRPEIKNTPIIIADINDPASVSAMCMRAKVIINVVGPYNIYGEVVVKSCIQNGTSHIDISGEPLYMENMQLKYDEQAKSSGVYIISACGFDSIPADLGLQYVKQNFDGQVNDVEAYFSPNLSGESYPIHSGTWSSLIGGVADSGKLGPVRRKIFSEKMPRSTYRLASRGNLFYSDVINKWCLSFLGSDKSVVQRSEYFLTQSGNQKIMTEFLPYIAMKSWFKGALVIAFFAFLKCMTLTSFTRNLMIKHPSFFSFGTFSHEGASREQLNRQNFSVIFRAKGWDNNVVSKNSDNCLKPPIPPNVVQTYQLIGPECGYIACSQFAVQGAYTVLTEKDKMPNNGGVLAPGAAFANTGFLFRCEHIKINRLN